MPVPKALYTLHVNVRNMGATPAVQRPVRIEVLEVMPECKVAAAADLRYFYPTLTYVG